MKSRLAHKARHVLHRTNPRHIVGRYSTARVVRRFADNIGMVYFGYVDQQDDDHRLLRGITVSTTHDDHYYSVGSFKGYDIALTVRRDTLAYPDKRLKDHHWTIMTFDLHTTHEVPHIYIGHHAIRDELLARYSELSVIAFGPHAPHSQQFLSQYTVYARMIHSVEVEQLLSPELTSVVAERFGEISLEIHDNTLYLYKPEKHPSRALLERMMNNGLWLASALDERLSK